MILNYEEKTYKTLANLSLNIQNYLM